MRLARVTPLLVALSLHNRCAANFRLCTLVRFLRHTAPTTIVAAGGEQATPTHFVNPEAVSTPHLPPTAHCCTPVPTLVNQKPIVENDPPKDEAATAPKAANGPAVDEKVAASVVPPPRISVLCQYCPGTKRIYSTVEALRSHLTSKHAHIISNVDEVIAKWQAQKPIEQHRCPHCTRIFSGAEDRDAHVRTKHSTVVSMRLSVAGGGSKPSTTSLFRCDRCRKSFMTLSAMQSHMMSKHPPGSNETTGNTTSSSPTTQTAPLVVAAQPVGSSSALWWCVECSKGFATNRALYSHMTTKHEWPVLQHPCPACPRSFPDLYTLRDHIDQLHLSVDSSTALPKDEQYRCALCGKLFLTVATAENHIDCDHRTEKEDVRSGAKADLKQPQHGSGEAQPTSQPQAPSSTSNAGGSAEGGSGVISPDDVLFA